MIRNCAYDCLNRLLLYLQVALRKSACMCELQKIIFSFLFKLFYPLTQRKMRRTDDRKNVRLVYSIPLYTVSFLLTSGRQTVEKLGKPVRFLFQCKRYIYCFRQ